MKAADLAFLQADYAAVRTALEEALGLFLEIDDKRGLAYTLNNMADTAREEGNYDARPTLAGVNRLTEAALEVVPAAGGFVVDGVWAGLRPAAPDRHPIVGWAAGLDGLMIATGHYRNGVLLGPLTGRRVAEQISTGAVSPELAPFGPERF